MTENAKSPTTVDRKVLLVFAMRVAVSFAVIAAILFGAAGRIDWPRGWAFFGLLAATLAIGASVSCGTRKVPARVSRWLFTPAA